MKELSCADEMIARWQLSQVKITQNFITLSKAVKAITGLEEQISSGSGSEFCADAARP